VVDALQGEILVKEVTGPLGKAVQAPFGFVKDQRLAVIEMADASGLRLIAPDKLDAMKASSFGTGELINEAVALGARHIILCIGGSATVDGGVGILAAMGYQFRDASGDLLPSSGGSLVKISEVIVPPKPEGLEISVLCDVSNPLLGPTGAAAVYGPQKGASAAQVDELEAGLRNWSGLIKHYQGIDVTSLEGGGAAGGVSAGLVGWLGAKLKRGAPYILELLAIEKAIMEADVVITAEGSLDEQTMEGKGPYALLELAKKHGKPVIGLAGSIPRDIPQNGLNKFDALLAIGNQPEPINDAIAHTLQNLERTAYNLGNMLALRS
jgi:glycerate kinase